MGVGGMEIVGSRIEDVTMGSSVVSTAGSA